MVGVVLQSIKDATQSIKDATQHMEDLAHVKGVCWCGLIILLHILFFYHDRNRTGQNQFSKVLYQCYSDVVFAVSVTSFWLQPIRGSQVASDKNLGAGH